VQDLIELGFISNTHGIRGDIKVTPWCDDISVFEQVKKVYVDNAEYIIEAVRPHKNSYIIKFKGYDNINQIEFLKNKVIYADVSDLPPLPDNTYYFKDLKNMKVVEGDKVIGVITDWFPTGSNDVYVVKRPDGREALIPAIKDVVKNVDVLNKVMTVELMEGLIEDED